MALKHLMNAIELLHAGMSISDIKGIIALPSEDITEPDSTPETEPIVDDTPEPEPEPDEQPETEPKPDDTPKPEPKKNPYQEIAKNVTQDTLINELNNLF